MRFAPSSFTSASVSRVATRIVDVVGALGGLIVLSPVLLVIGLAIKLHDGGSLIYSGPRVGRGGRPFRIHKFRTMVVDADRIGPSITIAGDRRVTAVGKLLRRYKIDELPQLWNVVKGEMSLVGPRPEAPQYVAQYTAEQRQVLHVRPGITGVAALAYREEEAMLAGEDWESAYVEQIMPAKLALEIEYLQRRTFWSDLGLLARTVWSLSKRRIARAHPKPLSSNT